MSASGHPPHWCPVGRSPAGSWVPVFLSGELQSHRPSCHLHLCGRKGQSPLLEPFLQQGVKVPTLAALAPLCQGSPALAAPWLQQGAWVRAAALIAPSPPPPPAPDLFSKMADWQTQQCMLGAPAHLPAAPGWEDLGRWGEGAVLARHCQGRGRTCGFIGLWLQFGALGACKPGWETPEAQNLLKCQTRRVTTPCFFCNKKLDSPL